MIHITEGSVSIETTARYAPQTDIRSNGEASRHAVRELREIWSQCLALHSHEAQINSTEPDGWQALLDLSLAARNLAWVEFAENGWTSTERHLLDEYRNQFIAGLAQLGERPSEGSASDVRYQ